MAKLSRYLKKAITWRIMASLITMIFLFVATRKVEVTLGYGLVEGGFKIFLYVSHEKVWDLYVGGK